MESETVRKESAQMDPNDGQANEDATRAWYRRYSDKKGRFRNDLLKNPEVQFQLFSYEASVINAIRHTDVDPETSLLLDAGCGAGGSTELFLRLVSFPPTFGRSIS